MDFSAVVRIAIAAALAVSAAATEQPDAARDVRAVAGETTRTATAPARIREADPTPRGAAPAPVQAPTLAAGDLVDIRVFDHPDLATVIRVPASGPIEFPLIGHVEPVAGRTVDDLAAELKRRLLDGWIRQADVTATVTTFAPRTAYVLGDVARPASVALDPFAPTTALQAIAAAGGFAADADRAHALVLRDDGHGRKTPLGVPSRDDAAADVALEPNDLVVVPRLDHAYVDGQVAHPGPITLPSDEEVTISKAISMAGGFERFAKRGDVQLIRHGEGARTIDVKAILAGKQHDDPALKPGDLVYVPESRF